MLSTGDGAMLLEYLERTTELLLASWNGYGPTMYAKLRDDLGI